MSVVVGYSGAAHRRVAIRLDTSAAPTPIAVVLQALYLRTSDEGVPVPRSGMYHSGEVATFDGREAQGLINAGAAVAVE